MAKFEVKMETVLNVEHHFNADRLDVCTVLGYQVITSRDEFKVGDKALYIPVDAVLAEETERKLFAGTRMQLSGGRVRAAKIRGVVSQGLLVSARTLAERFDIDVNLYGDSHDYALVLGITKYQPPVKVNRHPTAGGKPTKKRYQHPQFPVYKYVNHYRRNHRLLENCRDFIITEKLHGTNFRAGWVPFNPRTWGQAVKQFIGLGPKWEFVYGSHNVQLQGGVSVYTRCTEKYKLEQVIPKGQIWYGEIVGPGIQKNYDYSYPEGDFGLFIFDILDQSAGRWLNFHEVQGHVQHSADTVTGPSVDTVPVILRTTYASVAYIDSICNGPGVEVSRVDGRTTPIEGVVVRTKYEKAVNGQRCLLKMLSNEYLLNKSNTDYH